MGDDDKVEVFMDSQWCKVWMEASLDMIEQTRKFTTVWNDQGLMPRDLFERVGWATQKTVISEPDDDEVQAVRDRLYGDIKKYMYARL